MEGRFEVFFKDPIYRLYKNFLYNYRLRRKMIRELTRKDQAGRVLEAGCGISPMLDPGPSIVQTDISWQGLGLLRSIHRGNSSARQVACDATQFPFKDAIFDTVICSEVIEHIENDGQVLGEIHRVLRPGGELYLTCPIHQNLFGFDDEFVGHFRRYEVPELQRRLQGLGFSEFRARPLLGRLEKQIMEGVTRIFALMGRGEKRLNSREILIRLLAWGLFPVYFLANQFVELLVRYQVRASNLNEAVTVCVQCRKSA